MTAEARLAAAEDAVLEADEHELEKEPCRWALDVVRGAIKVRELLRSGDAARALRLLDAYLEGD